MKLTEEDIERSMSDMAYAETTQKSRRYVLRAFIKWLGDRDFNEDTVRGYARERYRNPKSRNTFIEIVRSFAKWKQNRIPPVGDENQLKRYELEQVRRVRLERVVQRIEEFSIPLDKLREVLHLLRHEELKFATVWCLAWFGCRPGELEMLRPDAVKYEKGEVTFETEKTKVQRKLYFDEFTGRQLARFLKARRGYRFIYKVCTDLSSKVGMHVSPKSFRGSFITEMQGSLARANFRPVRLDILVKRMAGHTVGDITSVYTSIAGDIRTAMLNHHYLLPLENHLSSPYDDQEALAIIEYVRENPGAVSELVSQHFGLSKANASSKLHRLEALGLLRGERQPSGRGRPRNTYEISEEGLERLRERG